MLMVQIYHLSNGVHCLRSQVTHTMYLATESSSTPEVVLLTKMEDLEQLQPPQVHPAE